MAKNYTSHKQRKRLNITWKAITKDGDTLTLSQDGTGEIDINLCDKETTNRIIEGLVDIYCDAVIKSIESADNSTYAMHNRKSE